jgi:hypothetical protein
MPSAYDNFANLFSAFLAPQAALDFRSRFTPLDFHNFQYFTVPALDWQQRQPWQQLLDASSGRPRPREGAAGVDANGQPLPQPLPSRPPAPFDPRGLPWQGMLQGLPPQNAILDALRALNPQIDFRAVSPNPWSPPNEYGVGITGGWRW